MIRARSEDWDDSHEVEERVFDAVACDLFSLDGLYIADAFVAAGPERDTGG